MHEQIVYIEERQATANAEFEVVAGNSSRKEVPALQTELDKISPEME